MLSIDLNYQNVLEFSILVFALYTINFYVLYFNRKNALPGPLPLPVVGNLLHYAMHGDMVVWNAALRKKYGDMWEVYVGSERHVWLSRADLVDKLYSTSTKSNYKCRTNGNRALGEIKMLNHGVFLNRDMDIWTFNRKMMKLVLTSAEFIDYAIKRVPKVFEEMEAYWAELGYISSDDKIFNLPDWFHALSLDSIVFLSTGKNGCGLASLFLSSSPNSVVSYSAETMNESKELRNSWLTFFDTMRTAIFVPDFIRLGTPYGLIQRRKFLKNFHWLNNNLLTMIREKRAEIESYDNNDVLKGDYNMLKLLLVANTPRGPSMKRISEEIDRAMTDDEIRGLLLEVLVASIETSASLMCFIVYLVCCNPEVKKKIWEEVDPLFRDDPTRKLQLDDLNNLPYVEAVIKEASRLLPPGPINHRVASHDDDIGGYTWKAGTQFMIDVIGIQNHPAHWSNPEKFIPERFLSRSENIVKNSFQPFGGGLRICPGRQYAMFLMKIVLASLYNRYDIELANENEKPVTPYRITLCCNRLRVKLKKRNE